MKTRILIIYTVFLILFLSVIFLTGFNYNYTDVLDFLISFSSQVIKIWSNIFKNLTDAFTFSTDFYLFEVEAQQKRQKQKLRRRGRPSLWLDSRGQIRKFWLYYKESRIYCQLRWYLFGPTKSAIMYDLKNIIYSRNSLYPILISGEPFLPTSGCIRPLFIEPRLPFTNVEDIEVNLFGLLYDVWPIDYSNTVASIDQSWKERMEEPPIIHFSRYQFGEYFSFCDLFTYYFIETIKEIKSLATRGTFCHDIYTTPDPQPIVSFMAPEHLLYYVGFFSLRYWWQWAVFLKQTNIDLFKNLATMTILDSFFTFWPAQEIAKKTPPLYTTSPITKNVLAHHYTLEDFLETAKKIGSSMYYKNPRTGKLNLLTFHKGFVCKENHYVTEGGFFYLRKKSVIYLKLLMLNDENHIVPLVIFPSDQTTVEYYLRKQPKEFFSFRRIPMLPPESGFEFSFRGAINQLAIEYRYSGKRWVNGYNVIILDSPFFAPKFTTVRDNIFYLQHMSKPDLSTKHTILDGLLKLRGKTHYFTYTHDDTAMFTAYSKTEDRYAHQAIYKDRLFTIYCDPDFWSIDESLTVLFTSLRYRFIRRNFNYPRLTHRFMISGIEYKLNPQTNVPELLVLLFPSIKEKRSYNTKTQPIIVTVAVDIPGAELILKNLQEKFTEHTTKRLSKDISILNNLKAVKKYKKKNLFRKANFIFQQATTQAFIELERWFSLNKNERPITFQFSRNPKIVTTTLLKSIRMPIHYRFVLTSDFIKYDGYTNQQMLKKFETSFFLPKQMQYARGIKSNNLLETTFMSRYVLEYEFSCWYRERFIFKRYAFRDLFNDYRYWRRVRQRNHLRSAYSFDRFEKRLLRRRKHRRRRRFRNKFGGNPRHLWEI